MLAFEPDGGNAFMVMELLAGERLASRLPRSEAGGLPVDEAMVVIRELGEILAYVHRRGVVHRDVKPARGRQAALSLEPADRPRDATEFLESFFPPAPRRRILPWMAVALVGGAIIGTGLAWVGPWHGGPEPPAPPPVETPPPVSAPAPQRPATLALTASQFRINESGGALRLQLRRPAGYLGPLRVLWRTVDQTARNGHDYIGSAGPDVTFLVELREAPQGPPLDTPARAEVTIVDDD